MKKISLFLCAVLTLCALFITVNKVSAEEKKVSAPGVDTVLNWIDVNDSYIDEKGVHGIRKANDADLYANGIGIKQQFNVENGQVAELEFQIPDYDHETRTLKNGHVSADVPYDIWLVNVDTGFNTRFRIWSNNTTPNASEESSWIEFCEAKTSNWETYSGGFISGVFTDASSFKISFDTTNFFSAACNWKEADEVMTPFHELGDIGNKKDQYLSFMQEYYGNATTIEFWLAHEHLEANTKNEVVIQRINGQSLKADSEQMIVDNLAPQVADINLSDADFKAAKNTEYTLRVEKYLGDPKTNATFYVHPSMDATMSQDEMVAGTKLKIKHANDQDYTYAGEVDVDASLIKKIVFEKEGSYELILEVTDLAGNIGVSNPLVVNVVKGYDIVLNGEITVTGKTNQAITLPTALATDENGVEREVSIKVEDPIGNLVEVNDYKFIPTSVGVYYVTYSSSYTDDAGVKHESSKIEREIIVAKGSDEPVENPSEDKGCFGSVIASVFGMSVLLGAAVLLKKQKSE